MILVSPLDGWCSPLDEVPDPVFSGKLAGDGVAIDPTSATLCAPCDAEVVTVATAKHAVTLRAANGAELLLHVGCDTVHLGGDGFEAHVSNGAIVRAGDPLIGFDLDAVASRVPSLSTPIILINGKDFEIARREEQRLVRAGDFLMELRPLGRRAEPSVGGGPEIRKQLRVPFEHGIHARPAALLVRALREFSADVSVLAHNRKANARSAVALMELGVRRGDEIALIAVGGDAEAALAALETVLMGARCAAPPVAPSVGAHSVRPVEHGALRGVIA
ncbi:MAG TPA: glucose PTS transporter subunit IIA, partial [Thermoanaerobaculia bacterium]|nr:glucose PTS transporter subunit IIA [Thermoanaerobaculia bacterium]